MRAVLYEPAGRGGVCHYTHQLGEHLVLAGVDVTLLTTEDYELRDIARHFHIDYLFGRSLLTRMRQRIAGLRRGISPAGKPAAPPRPAVRDAAASPARGHSRSSLLRKIRIRFLHVRTVCRFLTRRPDVVHFQWFVDRPEEYRFIRLLRWLGIPVVYTAHDVEPHVGASPGERRALQRIYDAVTRVIVHAESNKRELISLFGVDPSKIAVIPHGSYDLLCGADPLRKENARTEIGVPPGRKVILFFGLIKRYKGLEYLVEAFEEVRARVPEAFLLIVGDIFGGDAGDHRYYTRLLEDLRRREDVLCVSRYVPLENVRYYLAAADVVVLPYVRTYQSGVLLAAFAAGKPAIVTDTGGLSEVVKDGQSGFVVPPADAEALADAIVRIFSDPERLKAMGESAQRLATTEYAWGSVASRTLALYRSLAQERGSVPGGKRPPAGNHSAAHGRVRSERSAPSGGRAEL